MKDVFTLAFLVHAEEVGFSHLLIYNMSMPSFHRLQSCRETMSNRLRGPLVRKRKWKMHFIVSVLFSFAQLGFRGHHMPTGYVTLYNETDMQYKVSREVLFKIFFDAAPALSFS